MSYRGQMIAWFLLGLAVFAVICMGGLAFNYVVLVVSVFGFLHARDKNKTESGRN